MTRAGLLARARGRVEPGDARLLLRHVLGCSAAELIAHPEREVDGPRQAEFERLVDRRAAGEPVAYLLGWREFYGRRFAVSPAVLIPRPETELLVETALAATRGRPRARVLDLGAGSGCVAITLALELGVEVTAVDLSPAALAVAGGNAERLGARVQWLESDWYAGVAGRFDLIVGNPPYVAEGDPHLAEGDLRFEPAAALVAGADGLAALRHIVAGAPEHLAGGGCLWLEHGHDQAAAVRGLLERAGFTAIEQHRDLAGIVRVSGGRMSD